MQYDFTTNVGNMSSLLQSSVLQGELLKIHVIGDFLYQWDISRKIAVHTEGVVCVDFFKEGRSECYTVNVKEENGTVVADIPNILLQEPCTIVVYAVCVDSEERRTLTSDKFVVHQRERPDDYLYTETEIFTYMSLSRRIDELEQSGFQIPDNVLTTDNLQSAVEMALDNAKESGMFDGPKGDDAEVTSENIINALGFTPLRNDGGQFGTLNTGFSSPSSAGRVSLFNGAKAAEGAGIWLYGNDCDGEGKFRLQVYNVDTATYWAFDGKPNGDLLWGGGYLNPPLVLGTEYKTSFRYNGKVVYAKLVNGGTMPNTSNKTVTIGAKTPNIVFIHVLINSGTYTTQLPYTNISGFPGARFFVTSSGGCTIQAFEDLSAYSASILVLYTK